MDRRRFLQTTAAAAGAAVLGPTLLRSAGADAAAGSITRHSILAGPAAESGIDTVVICMMENRSFDAYLGWLARHDGFLEQGRSRYGARFRVDGRQQQRFTDPDGVVHRTRRLTTRPDFPEHWHGCGHRDPGHGWDAGRAQRDGGFLAANSGNDDLALSFMLGADLPVYRALALHFTSCDRAHASVLGPTWPNREYLLSAQSGGNKANTYPTGDGFPWATIIDRLRAAGVTVGNYYSDMPMSLLFGSRMVPIIRPMADFAEDAAAGRLPQVAYIDPSFVGDERSDDHPLGDPRAAQRFVLDAFRAFVASPQWERGLFIVTYDEWGGFFDHVPPPLLPDARASADDRENFGQAGFRVPVMLASPRALPGFVDHRLYDHTSIIRFLEWRFLGAPAQGPGRDGASWYLTTRDRYANNLGWALDADYHDPHRFDAEAITVGEPTSEAICDGIAAAASPYAKAATGEGPFDEALAAGYFERVGLRL